MIRLGMWSDILIRLPLLGAYGLGLVMALSLLIRRRDAPAWLGVIGFGVSLIAQFLSFLMNTLPLWRITVDPLGWSLYCLRVLLHLATAGGILCIGLALWLGLSQPPRLS